MVLLLRLNSREGLTDQEQNRLAWINAQINLLYAKKRDLQAKFRKKGLL